MEANSLKRVIEITTLCLVVICLVLAYIHDYLNFSPVSLIAFWAPFVVLIIGTIQIIFILKSSVGVQVSRREKRYRGNITFFLLLLFLLLITILFQPSANAADSRGFWIHGVSDTAGQICPYILGSITFRPSRIAQISEEGDCVAVSLSFGSILLALLGLLAIIGSFFHKIERIKEGSPISP